MPAYPVRGFQPGTGPMRRRTRHVPCSPGAMGQPDPHASLTPVLDRNIRRLVERERHQARSESMSVRLSKRITRFIGSMPFVYLHLALFGSWITINLGATPIRPFDPTFVVLAMIASVEAIFLSTFVLIAQNQMSAMAERNADLDLQISLLAEHEVTRLMTLVAAIARKLEIQELPEDELHVLQQDVDPNTVLDHIERRQNAE